MAKWTVKFEDESKVNVIADTFDPQQCIFLNENRALVCAVSPRHKYVMREDAVTPREPVPSVDSGRD